MNISTKLLKAASGAAGGAGLDVDDCFSCHLYTGTSDTGSEDQTIVNGINLSEKGGLVWAKVRSANSYFHSLIDTERGRASVLYSNSTSAAGTSASNRDLTSFNNNGFSLTKESASNANTGNQEIVSWTFRKSPMFDIVTYTGNGTTGTSSDTPQTISHNLGSVPGMIIVKKTSGTSGWFTFHRSTGSSKYLRLNATSAASNSTDGGAWGTYDPTSTDFKVGYLANDNGASYVAYLFAHNDGDGTFGPSGDQDVIKCGSYTGNGGTQDIDVGFEPQWVMLKNTGNTSNWIIVDMMRNFIVDSSADSSTLRPNTSDSEANSTAGRIGPRPNGFGFINEGGGDLNGSYNFIYMAIRRGPLAEPTSATDVFAIDNAGGGPPTFTSGFPVDMSIYRDVGGSDWNLFDRVRGDAKELNTNSTNAESSNAGTYYNQDLMTGIGTNTGTATDAYQWMWKRAPGYFDVVAYTGNNTSRSINHNLTVSPEMIWCKQRDGTREWFVFHKDLTSGNGLRLNSTTGEEGGPWESMTSTTFGINNGSDVNQNNTNFIAYLFATVAGVSKVGSVSHTSGSGTNVDCGFSNGARFIILKRYDAVSDWWVFDTVRGTGIAVGNDARLILNKTNAETSTDQIDPYSAGFTIDGNRATGDYIFYAIA